MIKLDNCTQKIEALSQVLFDLCADHMLNINYSIFPLNSKYLQICRILTFMWKNPLSGSHTLWVVKYQKYTNGLFYLIRQITVLWIFYEHLKFYTINASLTFVCRKDALHNISTAVFCLSPTNPKCWRYKHEDATWKRDSKNVENIYAMLLLMQQECWRRLLQGLCCCYKNVVLQKEFEY